MALTLSKERACAEALMMACDERLGAQSPAALMVCDTFLARDFWTSFVHQSYLPPAMWAWGNNDRVQLGVWNNYGDEKHRPNPIKISTLRGRCIHAVACGEEFSMAMVDDGELWATGRNNLGQLGLGDKQQKYHFTRVSGLSGRKVAAVACGNAHTLALLESGELFAWGWNVFGQLGLGNTTTKRTTPEPVAALSGRRVAAMACGSYNSAVVLETGELFAWGRNYKGQLGLGGDNAHRNVPTQVTALAGRRVVAVACGEHHTAAVLESGELFTWGFNKQGQLGHGDLTFSKNTPQLVEALRGRPVIAVACGYYHTLALLKTGEVFAWGKNDGGQLGLGEFSRDLISTPQQVHFFDGKRVMSIHCGGGFSGAVLGASSSSSMGNLALATKRAEQRPRWSPTSLQKAFSLLHLAAATQLLSSNEHAPTLKSHSTKDHLSSGIQWSSCSRGSFVKSSSSSWWLSNSLSHFFSRADRGTSRGRL